ncbi:MBL fold metallo-hydrolase [Aquibacillus sp. 3ASR75-11]|uniref:MBL fold metallo-hydrolase n=1 Tax=Terrihalobacillus insolitus TaxID=2950438 RepID=A0A9X4AKK6_9BACI|nr:MBL fold metallo-hydrolase [Terrihalobacillus insolitus]MDC3412373.1 MBL fold metallo-hydrolase [Terrihalobacillus insolitus]MDC3422934.1 MBL fold metallo-hydrolase [Terrihalobacillus insolitus]
MSDTFKNTIVPVTSITSGIGKEIANNIFCFPVQIVNTYFVGSSHEESWFLVDAGMPKSADKIIEAAEKRYGSQKPAFIILTHGHFDHVGALVELIEHWKVPVYAHDLEIPYLTGKADYPKGDRKVNGGLISEVSPLFPNHSINVGENVHSLPEGGNVPRFPEWAWMHTPGHTKGHISLFRDEDRALIAGDAFVTVKQESLYKVFTQTQEISGPPKYFTTNWKAARASVQKLKEMNPRVAATGHGIPMHGNFLSEELEKLVNHFDEIAKPSQGDFVH